MINITVDGIIALQSKLISNTGGAAGIRDIGLIESALYQIDQSFNDAELYPSIKEKAARLCYCLISNHGFVDGNKRIGIFAMLVYIEINNDKLSYTQQELVDLGLGVASGNLNYEDVLKWVLNH